MNSRLPIILASTSARRKQLLAEAGYDFKQASPVVDESVFSIDNIAAEDYAKQLALAKAKSVADGFKDFIVIGADTVADLNGCTL